MPTLSLSMIVKNEEAYLGACLASVAGLVDEIVVVDTGSTDGTRALAQARGARVLDVPWCDDFSAARNASLAHCTGDWILVLDADETLDARQAPVLRAAMGEQAPPAHRLILRNRFRDGNQTTLDAAARLDPEAPPGAPRYYADGLGLRFCRNLEGLRFTGRIHELLDPFFEGRGLAIGELPVVVDHHGKLDTGREREKRAWYLELARRDVAEQPRNHQFQFNLLQQAVFAGAWPEALAAARSYLELQREVPPMVLLGGALALQALDSHREAVTWLDLLLGPCPDHAVALTRKAVSLAALGEPDGARRLLQAALRARPGFLTPCVNLAELEGQQGRYPEARAVLEAGLDTHPAEPLLWNALVRLDVEHGRPDQACLDAWKALRACPGGGNGTWQLLVATQLAKQGQPGLARTVLATAPEDPDTAAEIARLRHSLAEGP